MALTIYGSSQSRTLRVLWMAEELGLDYDRAPAEWDDQALKAPAFLAINPAGRIPAIMEDGFALSESLAITLYLAKAHGSPLYPASLEDEARTWSWTLWATYELESFLNRDARRPPPPRDLDRWVAPALRRLEDALKASPCLLGEAFSAADLNVACVLSPSRTNRIDLAPYPAVRDWLERCRGRPAWIRTRALQAG